jgi:hypothetical protein
MSSGGDGCVGGVLKISLSQVLTGGDIQNSCAHRNTLNAPAKLRNSKLEASLGAFLYPSS